MSTLAGQVGWSNRGHQDGPGAQARFSRPGQLAIDDAGNLLVVEEDKDDVRTVDAAGNVGTLLRVTQPQGVAVRNSSVYVSTDHTIIKITAGVSTLVAGQVSGTFDGVRGPEVPNDGIAGEAHFYFPRSLGLDGAGNVFVDDAYTIRKVSPDAVVSTLAGLFGCSLDVPTVRRPPPGLTSRTASRWTGAPPFTWPTSTSTRCARSRPAW